MFPSLRGTKMIANIVRILWCVYGKTMFRVVKVLNLPVICVAYYTTKCTSIMRFHVQYCEFTGVINVAKHGSFVKGAFIMFM